MVDISVSKQLSKDEMTLVLNCMNGFPHDLHEVHHGAVVMLKKDDTEHQVLVSRGNGDECGFHYIEVGTDTAKALGLQDGARYLVQYNELSKTLGLTRALVSRTHVPLQIDRKKHKVLTVTIGYAQLCKLGMAGKRPSIVTLTRGPATVKLKIYVPDNELDEGFHLSTQIAAKLGLNQGQACLLEYNQSTKILMLAASGTPSHIPIQQKIEKDKSILTGNRNSRTTSVRKAPASAKASTKLGTALKRHHPRAFNKPTAAHPSSNPWLSRTVTMKLR